MTDLQKLGEIADVFQGSHFRGRIDATPDGDIPVLQVKDLTAGALPLPESLGKVIISRNMVRHLTQPGDIIYLARGTRNEVAVAEIENAGILIPSYFLFIRPNPERLNSRYLAWYLGTPQAKEHLETMRQGTFQVAVPASAMRELLVPLPPLSIQHTIGELHHLAGFEQQLIRKLAAKRQQLIESQLNQTLTQLTKGKN